MDYDYDRFIYEEPTNKEESFSLLIYDIISNSKRAKFAKFMEKWEDAAIKDFKKKQSNKR